MTKPVLVVDDEPDIAVLLRMVLTAAGYGTQCAADLATARALLSGPQPAALVVLDRIPLLDDRADFDGFDLCREIKASRPEVPVVVLTSRVTATSRAEARAAGADHFLTKPFDPDVLQHVVRLAAGDAPDRRRPPRASGQPTAGEGRRWVD